MSFSSNTNNKRYDLDPLAEWIFKKKLSSLSPSNSTLLRNKSAKLLDKFYFEILKFINIEYFIECGAYDAKNSYNLAVLN